MVVNSTCMLTLLYFISYELLKKGASSAVFISGALKFEEGTFVYMEIVPTFLPASVDVM